MKARTQVKRDVKIVMELSFGEAKALDAIMGYDFDEFIKVFKKNLGEAYIKDYEKDARNLFESGRGELSNAISIAQTELLKQ